MNFHIKKFPSNAVENQFYKKKTLILGKYVIFKQLLTMTFTQTGVFYYLIWESVFFRIIFVKIYHILVIIYFATYEKMRKFQCIYCTGILSVSLGQILLVGWLFWC